MFCMAESPAPAIAVASTERSWREMPPKELAIGNLDFQIEKVNAQINMSNPFDGTSARPVGSVDATSGMDVKDSQVELTDHKQNQFDGAIFDEENSDRVRKLQNRLDALLDEKDIVENGGKKQDELIDMYAAAERERMEKLEEKSRQK